MFPRHVQLLLTERCNLGCIHCAVPVESSPATTELDTAAWLDAIERLGTLGLDSMTVAGGEALLRRDAIQLAEAAVEAGVPQVTIVSNGALPSERLIDELATALQRTPALRLHLSIDGASRTSHDAVRGLGTFARTLDFAQRLRQAGGRVDGVQCVLSKLNIHELVAVEELTRNLGAQFLVLFPLGPVGRGIAEGDRVLDREAWMAVFEQVAEWRRSSPLEIHLHGPILGSEWPVVKGELVPKRGSTYGEAVVVGPDGELFTCPPLRHVALGNIVGASTDEVAAAFGRGEALMRSTCSLCRFQLMCCGVDRARPLELADGSFADGDPAHVVA